MTEGASLAQQGATPLTTTAFSPGAVNQYESPYQSDVINATEALENQQDAQQKQSLQGNITAAGAFGGDRSAILQSELAGQQSLANNSTNANLENQNYNQALGEYNTQNQLNLQTQQANNQNAQAAGYELGSLGTALQNSALTGANSLLNAGTLQQNTAQNQDTAAYQQYLQQLAYPYQSEEFLASLLPGIAQGTGITSTGNSSSTPALFGSTGSGSIFTLQSGGRASVSRDRLAVGGLSSGAMASPLSYGLAMDLYQPASMTPSSSAPQIPNFGTSYVPGVGSTSSGMPLSGAGSADAGSGNAGTERGGSGSGGLGAGNMDSFLFGNPATSDAAASSGLLGSGGMGATLSSAGSGIGSALSNAGSDVLAALAFRKGGRTSLADGGAGGDADGSAIAPDVSAPVAQSDQAPAGASALSLADTPPSWRGQVTNYAQPTDGQSLATAQTVAPSAPPSDGSSLSTSSPTWNDGTPVSNNQGGGLGTPTAPHEIDYGHQASIWPAIVAGIGGLFDNRKGAIPAALDEWEKDNHPDVDHSGPTTVVRYADGTTIDTGAPTEAAMNAKAMNDYRMSNLDMNRQTREERISEQANAAAANTAEHEEAVREAQANRELQLRIAQMNADQGHYTWQAGTQPDPKTGQPIAGMWRLSTRGGEPPQFFSGDDLTGKSGAGGAGISGREGVYFNRVAAAGNEAAAAARNIMELPTTASTGWFGGRQQGPGLMDALKEHLTNGMTSQDVQDYNTMVAGVARNLSAIEAAGLSPNGSLQHSMNSVILNQGDTELTKMRKMAEMRQIVEMGLEPNLANPRIPPEQKQLVQKIIGQMQQAIPFTQHDVTMLEQSKNPRVTMSDIVKQRGLSPQESGTPATGGNGNRGSAPQYQNGQIYRDARGNRARYMNGNWQPVQ